MGTKQTQKVSFYDKETLLPLNLQFFGDDNPAGGEVIPPSPEGGPARPEGEPTPNKEAGEPAGEPAKTYTQAEVDREISKVAEKNRAKVEAELREEMKKTVEDERNKALEYEKLTQKEKADADRKEWEDKLTEREKALNDRELMGQIESDLKENGLPASLGKTLLGLQDNEKIKEAITDIKGEFDQAVNAQVKEALRQDTPNKSSGNLEVDPFEAKLKKWQ